MIATAEAKCEIVVRHVVLGPSTLPATLCLHFLVARHRITAASAGPVGLLPEDSWIWLSPLLSDVLPFWSMVQTPAVNTLTVGILLTCELAIVHNNPPWLLTPFLRVAAILYTKYAQKVKSGNFFQLLTNSDHPRPKSNSWLGWERVIMRARRWLIF